MSNVLSDEKRQQILGLGRLGWTLRRIQEATQVRRETISKYLKEEGIPIRPAGRWGRTKPKPANEVTTDSSVVEGLSPTPAGVETTGASVKARTSRSEAFHEVIAVALEKGRNATAIFQDLVENHGFPGSYESVKRYARKLRGAKVREAHPVIETAPGEEGQVDYGNGPWVRAADGRYRRPRLFVMTLGFSRKSVRLLAWKSSSEIWARLHEKAFLRFGVVPRTIVLDNLKEGVKKPDPWDADVAPVFRDMLRHYGVVALPCRVRHPNRKGKVESGVGHAQRTPLQGMKFESLEEAQAYLDNWETRWADTRIHGTTKKQVSLMFQEEKPHLLPLPVEPFRYYQSAKRIVHLDGCVQVEGAYYSVPPGHVSKQVDVQYDTLHVRILEPSTGQLLREHLKQSKGKFRISDEDRPRKTPQTTLALLQRAAKAGKSIGTLCEEIHRREPDGGERRILGVLALAKKFGVPLIEQACFMGLSVQVPTYRFVRRYAERQAPLALNLKQVDEIIRPLIQYRDFIHRITTERETSHEHG